MDTAQRYADLVALMARVDPMEAGSSHPAAKNKKEYTAEAADILHMLERHSPHAHWQPAVRVVNWTRDIILGIFIVWFGKDAVRIPRRKLNAIAYPLVSWFYPEKFQQVIRCRKDQVLQRKIIRDLKRKAAKTGTSTHD